jgi:hypothetical protein
MAKGGGFVETMFAAGVGAYAAKKSGNMSTLLVTLIKYTLGIFLILLVIYIVSRMAGVEKFSVPVTPSKEGDEKMVTPAGNIILY